MSKHINNTRPLSEQQRRHIRSLIGSIGEGEAASRLGIARNTLARAVAGFSLYPGTIVLVEQGLAREVTS